jgi:hypothetical protein
MAITALYFGCMSLRLKRGLLRIPMLLLLVVWRLLYLKFPLIDSSFSAEACLLSVQLSISKSNYC